MLPQHGGVPNFRMRIPAPAVILIVLVLLTGSMLSLSLFGHADAGDLAAINRAKLCAIATVLLTVMILIASTGRWWHPHLWHRGNSQKHHRKRTRHRRSGYSSRRHHHR
jgi:fumarate reductase subunit D